MEKEKLISRQSSVTLNVTANQIDSYRRTDETQNTVRVYDGGAVGIAGSLGRMDEAALTDAAREALSYGIQYPCSLEDRREEEHDDAEILPEDKFLLQMQQLLDRLTRECPRFAISNKITLSRFSSIYENSRGSLLQASGRSLLLSLIFQNRGSGNLFDCAYGALLRSYDEDAVAADCRLLHDAFFTPVELEDGDYPVIYDPALILGAAVGHFVGEQYASGASLLSGKLGQKVFSENLTLGCDRNSRTAPGACFFDAEGQVAPDHRPSLVDAGVLTHVLTTKGTAAMLGLVPSATSAAGYDSVPVCDLPTPYVQPTAETLTELAPGRAVYVYLASGGDMTPDGHYASPVQLAYLVENGRIVGRLPELNISGDFFRLLGEDYLGAAPNTLLPSTASFCMVSRTKVSR